MKIEELTNEIDRRHATRAESAPSVSASRPLFNRILVNHNKIIYSYREARDEFHDTDRRSPIAQPAS
jgi:hypothetical protein